jgi:hypothetical protein
MYPPLSTRRRILLALLVLGGKSTYLTVKSFLPVSYSGPKFYAMLKRLEKEDLIRRGHQPPAAGYLPFVRLLPAGLELLERRYGPRILRLADKSYKDYNPTSWSLIILNFPTDQAYSRSRLAGRLLELGCGPLRDGVYLSPYPILDRVAQWTEENHCLDRVFLLPITNYQLPITNLLSAWDLPRFFRHYFSFLDRLTIARGISLPQKRNRALSRIKSDFLDLLIQDPLLSRPLLPADYPLARVIKVIARPPQAAVAIPGIAASPAVFQKQRGPRNDVLMYIT